MNTERNTNTDGRRRASTVSIRAPASRPERLRLSEVIEPQKVHRAFARKCQDVTAPKREFVKEPRKVATESRFRVRRERRAHRPALVVRGSVLTESMAVRERCRRGWCADWLPASPRPRSTPSGVGGRDGRLAARAPEFPGWRFQVARCVRVGGTLEFGGCLAG